MYNNGDLVDVQENDGAWSPAQIVQVCMSDPSGVALGYEVLFDNGTRANYTLDNIRPRQ